jgi:phosphate starvation-inducible PhoH-like protein
MSKPRVNGKRKALDGKVKDRSVRVEQRDKIGFDLPIDVKFTLTPKQQEFIRIAADKKTKFLLVTGAPGTSKSYLAVLAALQALKEKRAGEIHYIRQPVESSSFNIGFLKGEASSKLAPYMEVLNCKLREFLPDGTIKQLQKEERIKTNTPGFMRGASLNVSYTICDEAQNFLVKDFLLMMTRLGKFSKMIFAGDLRQSDIKDSGFERVFNLFDNQESRDQGIFTFKFGREDIVREEVIAFILDKFEVLGK